MKERENQDPEHRREVVKHALEGAALLAVTGLAYKLVSRDPRLRNRGYEAGDLVNSVALKVLAKADQFRGEANIKTWLHRVTVNTYKDEVDRIVRRPQQSVEDFDEFPLDESQLPPGPERAAIAHEEHELIMGALKQLSETERVVLFKQYFEGMTLEQIADELNMPLGTVKSHTNRGRVKLERLGILDAFQEDI